MRIVIAGLGSVGRRHLRNLVALGERDIILYRTRQSTLPDQELAGFAVETDLHAALAHRPAAVIVANPTALHLDVAIPAAAAGCHLLLEKPVAHSAERLAELQSAVAQGGGQVLVGFQFRFHPGLRRAAQLLAEGAIGQAVAARAHWGEYLPGWHPWEDFRQGYAARSDLGGGVILTLSHPLDYLRWLLGEVEVLWASSSRVGNLGVPVETAAEIGLRFRCGALGSVHLDYLQQPPTHHLEIVGTAGTIRWDNHDGVLHVYSADAGIWREFAPLAGFERNGLFVEEMRHFLAVARGEMRPACGLEDGIQALGLALRARSFTEETDTHA